MTGPATVPGVYLEHLAAVTAPDPAALRRVWEADGELAFPYAVGTPSLLVGVDALVGYFGGLRLFGPFVFTGLQAWPTAPQEWLVEVHGSSTLLATGVPYEQDYVVRFGLSERGRLAWMREFWDPTRAG